MTTAQARVLDSPFLKESSKRRHAVILLNWTLPDVTLDTWQTGMGLRGGEGGGGQLGRALASFFCVEPKNDSSSQLCTPINLPHHTSRQCAATLRICADGGANRLYEREQQGATTCHPHVIIGDLDSIRPEVAAHYRDRGAQVLDLSHDQDSTDLQKCVNYVETRLGGEDGADGGVDHIIAFGAPLVDCVCVCMCVLVRDSAAGRTQGRDL